MTADSVANGESTSCARSRASVVLPEPGERRLAGAGRTPQHHRREVLVLDHPTERATLAHEVGLAHEFVQGPWPHPRRERRVGGRAGQVKGLLRRLRGARARGVGSGRHRPGDHPTSAASNVYHPPVSTDMNLRIPGPTPLPERVREAGARQMVNHRGPEFKALIQRVTERLQTAFVTRNDILILTASGTGGLEAAIVNFLSPGDAVLGISIGSFGDRFAKIASTYGAEVTKVDIEWGHAASPELVVEELHGMAANGRPAKAVLLTHNETSTGVQNPLREIAAAVHNAAPDTLLLIDAISGLGAVPFETDAWGLDVVATGSQKSWMSPPGLAMISVSERAWNAAAEAKMPRFYFDLAKARKSLATGETPWTPAVGVLFAMDVALEMLEDEGYERVFAKHAACAAAAQAGLKGLGFKLFADPAHASGTVTAAWLPEGVDWAALNKSMRSRGLVVAGGQDRLAGQILRVGHLGDVTLEDVVDAIEVIGEALRELGREVDVHGAVAEARSAGAASSSVTERSRQAVASGA
jgi:aspartate aminotransferase-like enzyme